MMISFGFSRFLRVLRWEHSQGRRSMLIGALIAFVVYLLMAVPQFFFDRDLWFDLGQGLFWPLAFYALFGSAFFYTRMRTEQQRLDFFGLSASNTEKFVGHWLYNLFWFFAVVVLGFLAADLLQYLVCLVSGQGQGICFTLQFLRFYSGSFPFLSDAFPGLVATLWIHSIYLLGSQFFRRIRWLMTTLVLLVCYVISYLAMHKTEPLQTESVRGDLFDGLLCLLLIAFTVFNVWLAYRLFCRKQKVSN